MKKLLRSTLLLVTAGFFANSTSAIPTYDPTIHMLDQVIGSSITFGDKIFADFLWTPQSGSVPAADQMALQFGLEGTTHYLRLGGGLAVNNGASLAVNFSYSVTATGGRIHSIDQHISPTFGGTSGLVGIRETVRDEANNLVATSTLGIFGDYDDPPAEAFDDLVLLFGPLSKIFVTNEIILAAQPGGLVAATTFEQSFHQVPDTGSTLTLLASALGGLSLLRLRSKKA